jgi:murein DD-endopeptidase MepM/ murein hydrolase activator NlpD
VKTDHWLIVVSVLVLAALAGGMHLHTANTEQAQRIAALEAAAAQRAQEDASALVLLSPVDAPVSSPAGWRVNPMGGGDWWFHRGTDYSCPVGTPVRAAAAGVVVAVWPALRALYGDRMMYQGDMEWGNAVQLDHERGLWSKYAHLSRVDVRIGQRVEAGEVIGLSGDTGVSTGPHLHWEVVPSPEAALRWRIPR